MIGEQLNQSRTGPAAIEKFEPKIVAFLCTWCSYAGADLAGTGRNQYPPNIRVIRIPCSGRVNPIYIIKALLDGADGVMVSGCHPGDCHYLVGNYYARRRFTVLKKLLTVAGFEADRIQFTWVSASEGARFADVITEVTGKVSALGPNPLGLTRELDLKNYKVEQVVRPQASLDSHIFQQQQEELIPLCKKLLEDGVVDSVIGFQEGGETGLSLPYFFDSPNGADKLVWNDRCVPNLSGYLRQRQGKTAIIAKPCDGRAVVSYILENQLKREDIYIIGLACSGTVDDEHRPLPGCLDCRVRIPPVCDVLVGDPKMVDKNQSEYERQTTDNSWDRFVSEMEKCILCYSCRQSCYGCYCKTCFIDRGEPNWQPTSPDLGTKMLYHLGRAMHLAGRCVECGACENACASGVDIRYIIREVTRFIEDTYGYQTGMDLDTEPAMLTYKSNDREIGFLGGEDDA